MGTVNKPYTFVGDTKAVASEVNSTFDTIYNEFNGSVDDNNIDFNAIQGLKEEMFKDLYQVGDIWTTTQNVAPADKFGFGTWERFGEGRALVGYDSADTDFDTAEKTGGAKTHTLTDAEMPSHNHSGTTSSDTHNHSYTKESITSYPSESSSPSYYSVTGTNTVNTGNDTHIHSFTTSTAGSDNAHNNLQPYITVYMWKRTA